MTIPRDLSNLAPGANTSGVLQPVKGGTGLTAPGTNGNVLTSNGTAWTSAAPGGGFTLVAPQTFSSQNTKDFSGIPAGVKQVVVSISNVIGATIYRVQLGNSGTFQTSGYVGASTTLNSSTISTSNIGDGIGFSGASSTIANSGLINLYLQNAATNTWVGNGSITRGSIQSFCTGTIILPGPLSDLRFGDVTTTSLITGGSVSIMYI